MWGGWTSGGHSSLNVNTLEMAIVTPDQAVAGVKLVEICGTICKLKLSAKISGCWAILGHTSILGKGGEEVAGLPRGQ